MAANSRFFSMQGCPAYLAVPGGRLYERNPVTELFSMLTNLAENQWRRLAYAAGPPSPPSGSEMRLVRIYGPPGTGKSSAVWSWAKAASESAQVLVVWVRCDTAAFYSITNGTIAVATSQILQGLAQGGATEKCILVFDGILNSNKNTWIPYIDQAARSGVAVVLVSSEGVNLNEGSFQNITLIDHRVPGWTVQEYELALDDEQLFNAHSARAFGPGASFADRNQLISEKFFVAGHSARWMFKKTLLQVKISIGDAISAMQPDLRNVEDALRRPKFTGAVNKLMSWLHQCNGPTPQEAARPPAAQNLAVADNEVFFPNPEVEGQRTGFESLNSFVSLYVAQKMFAQVHVPSGDLRAMGLRIGAQSVVGYAFQQRFLELAEKCCQTAEPLRVTVGPDNIVEEWRIGGVWHDDPLEGLIAAGNTNRLIWAVSNTAAYDAILVFATGQIRFIQVTAGTSHSLKLYAAVSLLHKLEALGVQFSKVDFVVVRPADDTRSFRLDLPVGSFAENWRTVDDEDWAVGAAARDQVRKGTLAWA